MKSLKKFSAHLGLPIGYMKFYLTKRVGHHFRPGLIPLCKEHPYLFNPWMVGASLEALGDRQENFNLVPLSSQKVQQHAFFFLIIFSYFIYLQIWRNLLMREIQKLFFCKQMLSKLSLILFLCLFSTFGLNKDPFVTF